jgi:hypothetical protein
MGCFGSYYPSALWSEHNASPAPDAAVRGNAHTAHQPTRVLSRTWLSESLLRYTREGWFRGFAGAAWALREIGCDAIKSLLYLDRNGLWGRVCTSGIPEKHLAGVWSGALA